MKKELPLAISLDNESWLFFLLYTKLGMDFIRLLHPHVICSTVEFVYSKVQGTLDLSSL